MPFNKGQSGNPGGRPKRNTSLTGLLRKELAKKDSDKIAKKTRIVGKLIELAEGGDVAAIKYCFDRIDGRPTETISADISGAMTFDPAAAAEKLERILTK